MFIRQGTHIPDTEKLTDLKELESVSEYTFQSEQKRPNYLNISILIFQLRDEIIENFEDHKNNPFCDSNWKKLVQWKWNDSITDDQAQSLTARVSIQCNSDFSVVRKSVEVVTSCFYND